MQLRTCLLLAVGLFLTCASAAQDFAQQDSLRGAITPERAWWDLNFYHLSIRVDPDNRSIAGQNLIRFTALAAGDRLQIDLQEPLQIENVTHRGKSLAVSHEGAAHYVDLPAPLAAGDTDEIIVTYSGQPRTARMPPWDGGFTWKKDSQGQPFIATACQGEGPSLWWPCKDHPYDEVDSMAISVRVPGHLMDVSNGRLRETEAHRDGTKTYHWFVSNPINSYGVNVNIADYAHFGEVYKGEKGNLDCDYYVLRENLATAKKHFEQVKPMLAAFEYWFGPYPFYEDGFKLVEVPYLGMEHQSSVTYGNKYLNGYLGNDLSGTGWGEKFDFIIIHESGHEWFANNITNRDVADMWLHEGFTAYAENIYLNELYGKEAASAYVRGTRSNVQHDRPIQSPYRDVSHEPSSDMYYKGANLLHTLRAIINDDALWRQILRGLNKDFYHQTVTSQQVEEYIAERAGRDLATFFDQYLRTADIPIFEYRFFGDQLEYRWVSVVTDFAMPLRVWLDDTEVWLYPTAQWQEHDLEASAVSLRIDPDFYIATADLTVRE